MNILHKIKNFLWGDLSKEEFKRIGMLALTFLFLIGSYWLLRPLKDGIFIKFVGKDWLPYAKIVSFFWIIPLVLIYGKLVDLVAKQKLFYIICISYATFFTMVALILKYSVTMGVANTVASGDRLLGWFFYLAIESFGSLLVALFWSFVASNTPTETAKKGFGLIIFGGQIGSISGPLLATRAKTLGLPFLTSIVVCGLLIIPVLIKIFITIFPEAGEKTATKKKTGALEGARLIATRPYLIGVLGISTLYEIVATILDLQFKFLAADAYPTAEGMTAFLGWFGATTNGITLVFTLIGTSFIIRKMGLLFCLAAFPVTAAILVLFSWSFPFIWVVFICMAAYKAFSYALNNPCKEIMYIPTSKDVKFKAKSCIDMFGARSAKASGSGIKALVEKTAASTTYGAIISLAIIGFVWLPAALYVGRKNKELVESGKTLS